MRYANRRARRHPCHRLLPCHLPRFCCASALAPGCSLVPPSLHAPVSAHTHWHTHTLRNAAQQAGIDHLRQITCWQRSHLHARHVEFSSPWLNTVRYFEFGISCACMWMPLSALGVLLSARCSQAQRRLQLLQKLAAAPSGCRHIWMPAWSHSVLTLKRNALRATAA